MTTYGPRHVIEDEYGQDVQVAVELGEQATVGLSITAEIATAPPAPLRTRRETTISDLTPDAARNLAKQLQDAAGEAESYE